MVKMPQVGNVQADLSSSEQAAGKIGRLDKGGR